MLKLKNVSKFYYSKGIIASGFTKINLELKMGEFVAITGESGSGKSTLLNVISGLDSYEEGEMYINGEETSHYTEREFEEYRRKYIANIFQSFNLVNSYTVYQNVELVLLLNGYKKRAIKKKVLQIIDEVGLTKFKNTKVSKLSGGQKQRVAIARAMVKDTPIIVADEPTGNLDSESAKDVIEILKRVAKNKLVIVVTHNIEQVEEYATRIIKMHDGRIIENREVKEIKENIKPEESIYTKITVFNKLRLGTRNTFNILPKFLLLFAVFFFITMALLSEYASFKTSDDEIAKQGYNMNFQDLSENRLLITKGDRSEFTTDDYEKIKMNENVDYIVEDDLYLDKSINLFKEEMGFGGRVEKLSNFKGDLAEGTMPEEENEAVIMVNPDNYFVSMKKDEIIGKEFTLASDNGQEITKVIVTGLQKYEDDLDFYSVKIYISDKTMSELRTAMNKSFSDIKILFNDKYTEIYDNQLLPSEKVEPGCVIINDENRYQFSNLSVKNRPLTVVVNNLYYEDVLDLTVSNTFTKNNFNRVTGYDNYDRYSGSIFINKDEYEAIYNKPSHQSSVFVKDVDKIDETVNSLQDMGFNVRKITDFRVNMFGSILQVAKIFRVIVVAVLLVVLFFISYFIVKIILKSRNIYYTTLRMLGATYNSIKRILDIELFINSTLAYCIVVTLFNLVKYGIIQNEHILKLTHYLGAIEYIIVYLILFIMVRLISIRFSSKIFKKSAINTYNEEV